MAPPILPGLECFIVLDFQGMARSIERFSSKHIAAEQGPEGVVQLLLSYDTSQGCTIRQPCATLLSMQATAAVLQTVKNKLAAETHTAPSRASDLANAVADGHIETTADGKLPAPT